MKKTRFIAIALVIAVMLMGAGYAYWNDTLTIDNTVSTGEFDMDIECIDDVRDYDNFLVGSNEEGNPFGNGDDYVNPEIDDCVCVGYGNDKIVFTNTNLYPGSGACISFKLSNNGTVPAKVDEVVGTVTTGSGIKDEFIYTIGKVSFYEKTASGINISTLYDDETPYYTFDEFIEALNTKLSIYNNNPIVLGPEDYIIVDSGNGDKMDLGYDIYFDPDTTEMVSGTAIATENSEFSFDIDFKYTQWNTQE